MDAVTRAVAAALEPAVARVYVGFSGGRDSTVLLHALAIQRRRGVVAVHVNHGLHPDADAWEAACAAFADDLGVAFLARRVTVSPRGSLEARARHARYRAFVELLDDAGHTLFLAHHRRDQSETVLLRLVQGRGLYGMPERRRLGAGVLVRPLLHLDAEILDHYARRHGLTWLDDPGNDDLALDRNFLRHRVLPDLRRRWPAVDRALLDAAEVQRLAAQRLLAPLAERPGALSMALLAGRPEAERRELVRLWLEREGLPSPSGRAIAELLRQVAGARPDHHPRLQVGRAAVLCYDHHLHVVPPAPRVRGSYPIAVPGTLSLPHGRLTLSPAANGFQPVGAVEVRFRAGGERLRHRGRLRSLKQLLQAARVPPWQRDRLPLVFDQEGLLAVPDIAERDHPPGDGCRVLWEPRRDTAATQSDR